MGRLNEQGLQRLVSNIKEDVNTRFETTNTEVENTKADILGIQNELDKSRSDKYQTVSGIKEFESKDGYIDNISMEGKTLVNVSDIRQKSWSNELQDCVRTRFYKGGNQPYKLISDGTYTFYNFTDKVVSFPTLSKGDNSAWGRQVDVQPRSCTVATISSEYSCVGADFWVRNGWQESDMASINSSYIMVIEGEHEYIPYFKGVCSIGQGEKFEVLTSTKNPISIGNIVVGSIDTTTGVEKQDANSRYKINDRFIECSTEEYTINLCDNSGQIVVLFYDENRSYISFTHRENANFVTFTPPSNARFLRFRFRMFGSEINTLLYRGNSETISYDKKQVPVTLRGLPNGIKDTIEKRGSKYYKVQRCGEYTLTGLETVNGFDNNSERTTNLISIKLDINLKATRGVCDRYLYEALYGANYEHFYLENGEHFKGITIEYLRSIASTREEYMKWLESNPTTIVYQLETPIITELPNFNPKTFLNKTAVLINSGAVQGDITFDVTSSLGSRIDVMSDKMTTYDIVASNFRNILFSTELPTDNQGNDGDIWIKYI